MNKLAFLKLVVYICLGLIVLIVTKHNNMWGFGRGVKQAKKKVQKEKDLTSKRLRVSSFLEQMRWICDNIGFKPSQSRREDLEYIINRLNIKFAVMNRNFKSEEVIGMQKMIRLIILFIAMLVLVGFKNRLGVFVFFLMVIPNIWESNKLKAIADEDDSIERDFPELYTLLYSRLLKGASIRLSPTLDEYLLSMQTMYGENGHNAIRKFVQSFRNNIELYGDDSLALTELRKTYKSAMIVNFFNVAIQSLRGVDNADKLLGLKMELQNKRLKQMEENAEKMVEKGKRAIMVIYIILGEFIVLSWVAKAGTDLFSKLTGLR